LNHEDTKDTKDTKGRRKEDRIERAATRVIGAAIEVHRTLGPGYLEGVYEEALAVELRLRGIAFKRQMTFALSYKGSSVGEGRLDFLVDDCLIVEIKAVDTLSAVHVAQALSYLKATGCSLALLINFNVPLLQRGVKRVII
jgi:GxxExxY protein